MRETRWTNDARVTYTDLEVRARALLAYSRLQTYVTISLKDTINEKSKRINLSSPLWFKVEELTRDWSLNVQHRTGVHDYLDNLR